MRHAWIRNRVGHRRLLIISQQLASFRRHCNYGTHDPMVIHPSGTISYADTLRKIQHIVHVQDHHTAPSQHGFQKMASTMPLPIAEPAQDQHQSVLVPVNIRESTDLHRSLRRQPRMSQAMLIIMKILNRLLSNINNVLLGQDHHRSDSVWLAGLGALAGQ